MNRILWVHHDHLQLALPGLPAIYIWDDAQLRADAWGLKRIGFIYESLLEIPVTIRRGDTLTELRRFAAENGDAQILTVRTPEPRLQAIAQSVKAQILEPEPFVQLRGPVSLRRFSQYWRKAEPALFPGQAPRK